MTETDIRMICKVRETKGGLTLSLPLLNVFELYTMTKEIPIKLCVLIVNWFGYYHKIFVLMSVYLVCKVSLPFSGFKDSIVKYQVVGQASKH